MSPLTEGRVGRALQEVFVDLVVSGLASMYPVSVELFCSGTIMDISAHAFSLTDTASTGHGGPNVRMRREDRSSILLYSLCRPRLGTVID